jgi:hypothetical protein
MYTSITLNKLLTFILLELDKVIIEKLQEAKVKAQRPLKNLE